MTATYYLTEGRWKVAGNNVNQQAQNRNAHNHETSFPRMDGIHAILLIGIFARLHFCNTVRLALTSFAWAPTVDVLITKRCRK